MKLLFFTSSRSDYGPFKPLIVLSKKFFDTYLLISGSHFLKNKGNTYAEIINDNILDNDKIFKISSFKENDDSKSLCEGIGNTLVNISNLFEELKFDGIVILGDRYELFTITIPALMYKIPIFHISGGEITEGVIDDLVRHSTTKLSHIHLVSTYEYAKNISLMGEEDWRINIVGECGLDNIYKGKIATKEEVYDKFGINLDEDIILVTYHPSTLDNLQSFEQINPVLQALKHFAEEFTIVFTGSGHEEGASIIENEIEKFVNKYKSTYFVKHFGSRYYLSVLKNSKVVVGNSSSGIIEAPSLNVPTVNIGNRQKNRLSAKSVINVGYDVDEIIHSIRKAINLKDSNDKTIFLNPYDPYMDGRGSERIIKVIQNAFKLGKEKLLSKKFDNTLNKNGWNYLLNMWGE